jgi:hypothetical protein
MREHREASLSASSDTRSESSALSTSKVVDSGKVSPTPSLSYDPVRLKNSKATSSTKNSTSKSVDTENDDETDLDIYSRSSVDDFDPATISADPKLSTLSKLTPVRNVEIGGLIPLSANGEIRHDLQVSILSGICPLKFIFAIYRDERFMICKALVISNCNLNFASSNLNSNLNLNRKKAIIPVAYFRYHS